MKFGIDKCPLLIMKRRKRKKNGRKRTARAGKHKKA